MCWPGIAREHVRRTRSVILRSWPTGPGAICAGKNPILVWMSSVRGTQTVRLTNVWTVIASERTKKVSATIRISAHPAISVPPGNAVGRLSRCRQQRSVCPTAAIRPWVSNRSRRPEAPVTTAIRVPAGMPASRTAAAAGGRSPDAIRTVNVCCRAVPATRVAGASARRNCARRLRSTARTTPPVSPTIVTSARTIRARTFSAPPPRIVSTIPA